MDSNHGSYAIAEENADTDIEIQNCLFNENAGGILLDEGLIDIPSVFALHFGVAEASDNLSGDPLFRNREEENFRLRWGSPAIDASSEFVSPQQDLDGLPRPVDFPGLGTDGERLGADLGAYEFQIPVTQTGLTWQLYD